MKTRIQHPGVNLHTIKMGETFCISRHTREGGYSVWMRGGSTSGANIIAVLDASLGFSAHVGAISVPQVPVATCLGITQGLVVAMELGTGRVVLMHPETTVEPVECLREVQFGRKVG